MTSPLNSQVYSASASISRLDQWQPLPMLSLSMRSGCAYYCNSVVNRYGQSNSSINFIEFTVHTKHLEANFKTRHFFYHFRHLVQGRSQDFHKGGCSVRWWSSNSPWWSRTWPALLAIGGGCRRGMCPSRRRQKLLAFLTQQLSISTDFYLF